MSTNSLRGWLSAHLGAVIAGAVALGLLVWMVIPAAAERGNVVLVGDQAGAVTFPATVTQVRDNGRQATPVVVESDPCAVADSLVDADLGEGADIAIITIGAHECADDPVAAAVRVAAERGLTPVVVRLPDTEQADQEDLDALVVDTEVLLGPAGTESRPCEWWDRVDPFGATERIPCQADDTVVVRYPDGSLTDDGIQRVARMTAAAIG